MNSKKIIIKEIKSKIGFENVKSNFILRMIFCYVKINRELQIIKHNKNLQNKLGINLNDIIEGSKLYSSIEIEIKPVNNIYGKFINISNEDKEYCKIYFDNSNEEIKRNYLNENENVNIIKILINYQFKSFVDLFSGCECIKSLFFKKFYRNNITDFDSMFLGCKYLEELHLSNLITENATNMNSMFYGCSSLKELNISNFNTDKVSYMHNMFYNCYSLKELNLSNFKISKFTNINEMFYNCSSLENLDISKFNITDTNHMYNTFYGCSSEFIRKIRSKYGNIKEEAI